MKWRKPLLVKAFQRFARGSQEAPFGLDFAMLNGILPGLPPCV